MYVLAGCSLPAQVCMLQAARGSGFDSWVALFALIGACNACAYVHRLCLQLVRLVRAAQGDANPGSWVATPFRMHDQAH